MEMDPLGAMQGERDRFAFENAELRSQIGHLKSQLAGEIRAKEEALKEKEQALRELDTTTKAWKSTHRTKEALTMVADLDQADAAMLHIARREEVEQELLKALEEKKTLEQHCRDLIARLDRDGGQRQDEDPSLAVSVERADKIIVDLMLRLEELRNHDGLLVLIREHLAKLTDEQRVKLFAEIDEGYCPSCGRKLKGQLDYCQCENDE